MVYVCRGAAVEGSEIGRAHPECQVGVEVVVKVSAQGEDWLVEGFPDADLSGG